MSKIINKIIPQILIVGDAAVGKTSLIRRYVDNKFSNNYIETIGSDLSLKDLYLPINTPSGPSQIHIRLRIYDIGGQEHYTRNMIRYAKTSQVFIICYDITRLNTFKNTGFWVKNIKENVQINPHIHTILLAGMKGDLVSDHDFIKKHPKASRKQLDKQRTKTQQVSTSEMQNFVSEFGGLFGIETSSKTGDNVEFLFDLIGKSAYNGHIETELEYLRNDGVPEQDLESTFIKKNGYKPELKSFSI
ncbi:MAG: Rab family GTPase [Promethearchaeota archaeon]